MFTYLTQGKITFGNILSSLKVKTKQNTKSLIMSMISPDIGVNTSNEAALEPWDQCFI